MAENGAIIAIYSQSETFFVEIRPVAAVRGRSNPGALGLARDSFIDSPSVTGFGKVALMSGFFPGYRDPAVIEEVRGGQGGIRTHGRLPPTAVFKTAALNHSATCPLFDVTPEKNARSIKFDLISKR